MRRAKGEGSVVRLKSGKWQARLMVEGKRVSRNASTKAEAVQILQDLKDTPHTPQKPLSVVLGGFYVSRKGNAPSTERRLKSTISTYVAPRVEKTGWEGLTSEWLDDLLGSGRSPSTVRKVRDASLMLARYAGIKVEMEMPRVRENKKVYIYNKDEIEKFREEALRKNANGEYIHRYGVALLILLYTGMRAGELCALEWGDVEDDHLSITKTYADGRVQDHPKTSASVRAVPMTQQAREMLKEAKMYGGRTVIARQSGGVVDPITLAKAHDRIAGNSGLPKYPGHASHILRDTFATHLYASCKDLLVVSRILGHSSVRVTERYYVTVLDKAKEEAMQGFVI